MPNKGRVTDNRIRRGSDDDGRLVWDGCRVNNRDRAATPVAKRVIPIMEVRKLCDPFGLGCVEMRRSVTGKACASNRALPEQKATAKSKTIQAASDANKYGRGNSTPIDPFVEADGERFSTGE
jgi:hypothetical protein